MAIIASGGGELMTVTYKIPIRRSWKRKNNYWDIRSSVREES